MSGSVAYVRPVFERLAPTPGSLVERILLKVQAFPAIYLQQMTSLCMLMYKHNALSGMQLGQHSRV